MGFKGGTTKKRVDENCIYRLVQHLQDFLFLLLISQSTTNANLNSYLIPAGTKYPFVGSSCSLCPMTARNGRQHIAHSDLFGITRLIMERHAALL